MRVLLLRVLKPVFAPLRYLIWRLSILAASREVACGIEVVCIAETQDLASVINCLSDAFELIAVRDPLRFHRLRKDVKRVLVVDAGGPEYINSIDACLLSATVIENATKVELALAIVHEAAHARLWRAGIGRSLAQRDRLERACINSERRFAEKLDGDDRVVARTIVNEKLAGPKWWTRETLVDRRIAELTNLGLPKWLIRLSRHLRV
jgi:hypothetical protein